MARNNPPSWGLKIPGRPPTPSEGYAQQYDRIGPAETQKLWTFDNGTCLTYGPDDLVDEFDPVLHPFCNQIALIDTLIRDNIAVRARYELSKKPQLGHRASPHSDMTAVDDDPFNNFRQRHLDPSSLPQVTLASGIYLQVPSRFASVSNMVSVYATPNKSDTPGEAHRGLSNDTRFGMCGKPSYNPQLQLVQRQDNIHRLTMQRQIQSGISRGRRGRGGRQLGHQQLARIPEQYHYQYNPERQNSYQPKGMVRGQQKMRSRVSRGRRKDSIHRHERFRSQAYSVADTPFSTFTFPIINNNTKKFALQDYEDEGPIMGTPYSSYGQDYFQDDEHGTDSFLEADHLDKLNLSELTLNEENTTPLQMVKGDSVHKAFAEELQTHPRIFHGATTFIPLSQGPSPPMLSPGANYSGLSQRSHAGATGRFEGYPPPLDPIFNFTQGSAIHPIVYMGQEIDFQDDNGFQGKENNGYGAYLDELSDKSRTKRDIELAGGTANGDSFIPSQIPAESIALKQGLNYTRELESKRSPTNNDKSKTIIIDSIQARRFRPGLAGSSTRPSSPVSNEEGRLSEPPRNRPSLLSPRIFGTGSPVVVEGADNKIFGENAGNVSAEPSPLGDGARVHKRRLFE